LTDFCDENAPRFLIFGAISRRSHDSMQAESALVGRDNIRFRSKYRTEWRRTGMNSKASVGPRRSRPAWSFDAKARPRRLLARLLIVLRFHETPVVLGVTLGD
jgi:hypothetical protein